MSEWKEYRLADIATLIGDGLHGTPIFDNFGTYYFVNGNNLYQGHIVIKPDTKLVNKEQYELYKKPLSNRTILLSINGTIGNIAKYAGEKCILGKSACFINVTNEVDRDFVYYILCSPKFLFDITNNANGSTIKNVSLKQIREYQIKLPTLVEQQKIAGILLALDEKIETNRKINARLEELAQTIFKSWFIDNAVYENSTIADFFLPIRGKSLLTSDAKLGEVPVVAGGLTPATYHNKSNTKAPVITISASGANAGFVNIWGCSVWSSDSSFIDNSITPYVYFWYSLLKYYQKIIYHSQTGCAQPHIYPKHIGNINIPCIEDRKMEIFEKVVTPLFEKLFENKKESARLATLRDTLLPKLMSGELIPE